MSAPIGFLDIAGPDSAMLRDFYASLFTWDIAEDGTVDVRRFEVPSVAVPGLFRDPAGNPLGLVEMHGDGAKIP